ncbi:T9SS type A sorting domain-containing protein [Chryseobacterium sp. PMSZPI]|uniref:T9SS type A sorting domain-containing protein n=1 Tax=Chryseobacterium sp. PMSZPI TaxID=1033900 RepID=UPI0039A13817
MLLLSCSGAVYSQLTKPEVQLWERTIPGTREDSGCSDGTLLNFHCGIKNRSAKKYIRYSRNKSHTLSLVHISKDKETIWENKDTHSSLGNNIFQKNETGKKLEIRQKPSIFSFVSTSDALQKKDTLEIRFDDKNLYELVFIPKRENKLELGKIHSYLSIKYGISLEKGKYYSSTGDVIWDPAKHKDYQFRPTGLGRDDGNELYQKQSVNQADLFLTIGMNDIKRINGENPTQLDDKNFVMWSDDGKDLSLKRDGNFNVLERNWEINFIGSKIPKSNYKVRINKTVINPDRNSLVYWMFLKNASGNITKIQGVENENYIDFSRVDFSREGDHNYFTFASSSLKDPRETNTSGQSSIHNETESTINLDKIVLYPNPVKKGQNFTVVFPPMENLEISVYDGAGRLVKLEKIDRNSNHYLGQLGIQSSYIVNLTQNGKIIKTFKLIVD